MPINPELEKRISSAKTLGDIFREVQAEYDLDKVQVGFLTKNIIVQKIGGIVDLLKVPKKNGSIRRA